MTNAATELVRRRFGNQRPGLDLLGLVDAALPVSVLRVDVLAQERKALPLLDEFLLQFVHEGVQEIDELTALLGLDRDQVLSAAADQISQGNLRRSDGRLALTTQGLEVARDLAAIQPVLKQLPVPFDRVTWTVENYAQINLIRKQEAQDRGYLLLPAKKHARVTLEDLPIERFNAIVRQREDRNRLIEVLRIRKIASQSQHRYLPTQLLVYGNPETGEVELGLCIENELQPAHTLELSAIGAVSQLGIQVGRPEPRPTLNSDLEKLRVPAEEVEALAQVPTKVHAGQDKVALGVAEPHQRISEMPVRSVSVFEHPDHLNAALDTSKKRLLIISPWVKGGVVNADFVSKLERRVRAGVDVHIGYGIGPDDSGSDERALRRLSDLSNRHKVGFNFVRLANTHAKILIYDGIWINTSFNWLSFRGDPNRTFRMEEGTLVQIPSEVDKAFAQYVAVLEADAGL